MGYDFQPAENLPLSYNSFQGVLPTPPVALGTYVRLEQSSAVPIMGGGSIPIGGIRERSLHTGEVVGSIPTAPTIDISILALLSCYRAHVSPMKTAEVLPANLCNLPCL